MATIVHAKHQTYAVYLMPSHQLAAKSRAGTTGAWPSERMLPSSLVACCAAVSISNGACSMANDAAATIFTRHCDTAHLILKNRDLKNRDKQNLIFKTQTQYEVERSYSKLS